MYSSGLRVFLLAIAAMALSIPDALAQSQFPPTVTITGTSGPCRNINHPDCRTEGTIAEPFQGTGISLRLEIEDQDPTTYNISSWTIRRGSAGGSGRWCNQDDPLFPSFFQLFGTEVGGEPSAVHPAVESGTRSLTVTALVSEAPHPPVQASRVFIIAPRPSGCSGGGNPGGGGGPSQVSLQSGSGQVQPGQTIRLTASARDSDSPTLQFMFSSGSTQFNLGTPLGNRTGSGCNGPSGCQVTFDVIAPLVPGQRFFQVQVQDNSSSVSSPVIAVEVSNSGVQPPPAGDNSPAVCNCPGGGSIRVDAGPRNAEITGGRTLQLQGEATGPVVGGGGVVPGSFTWTVLNDGGLNGISLSPDRQLLTNLGTPDISGSDVSIRLQLEASFASCVCQDTIDVNILADEPPGADLRVVHNAPQGSAQVGENITYNLAVSNLGPGDASNVVLDNTLAQTVTLLGASGGCQGSGGQTVRCTVGDLDNGQSRNFSIQVRADAAGTITNTAQVASTSVSDPVPGNNTSTASTTVTAQGGSNVADLSIAKNASQSSVQQGGSFNYTLTVGNAGPNAATNVTVTDNLPAGLTLISSNPTQGNCSGGPNITCNLGGLAVGSTATITLTVRADAQGSILNTANVSGAQTDNNSGNNSSSINVVSSSVATDLAISKIASVPTVRQGDSFTYTLQVTNNGPEDATGVTVTDPLPSGIAPVSATPSQGSCNPGSTVVCTLGSIANGQSATVSIQVLANTVGEKINTATVASNEGETSASDNSSTAEVEVADGQVDLEVFSLVADPWPVDRGEDLTFTARVRNNGPDEATNVTLVDQLPTGFVFQAASSDSGSCSHDQGTVTCDIGSLPVDGVVEIQIAVEAQSDVPVSNAATVQALQFDTEPSNDTRSIDVNVVVEANTQARPNVQVPLFMSGAEMNPSDVSSEIVVRGLLSDGTLMDQVPRTQLVPPRGQDAFLNGELPVGGDAFLFLGRRAAFQGFFMLGQFSGNSQRLDGVGAKLTNSTTLYLPSARQVGIDRTDIFLFNPQRDGDDAFVFLTLRDPDGNQVDLAPLRIPPLGSVWNSLSDLFDIGNGFEDGYIEVESSQPVQGFEMLSSGESFATIPAQTGFSASEVVAPHFFIGLTGETTFVRLLNIENEPARAIIKIFTDGEGLFGERAFTLPPNSVVEHDLTELFDIDPESLTRPLSGFLEVELSVQQDIFLGDATVVPIVTYQGTDKKTLSSLTMPRNGRQETLFLHIAQSPEVEAFTGLAIYNRSLETTRVMVQAFDRNGVVMGEKQMDIAAGTRVIGLLDDSVFFDNAFTSVGGHLRVISENSDTVAFALFGGTGENNFLAAIEGQSPSDQPAAAAQSKE